MAAPSSDNVAAYVNALAARTADALADTQQHHAASLLALQVRAGGGDG